ncbi:MAG: GNAT family N-acetyltransferase [Desulfovibrio sp.]|nr:GNAT family N-acetyltransferase [Desulfovibrio sp.]
MTIRAALPGDFARLLQIWEAAVRASHDFLTEDDIADIREQLSDIFPQTEDLVVSTAGMSLVGFMGLCAITGGKGKVDMLFIDPAFQAQGVGTDLLDYAKSKYRHLILDVNEQNRKARIFYEKNGFVVMSRSAVDSQGRPLPLLHLRYH